MAELSGVKVLPERIEYEGVTYEESEERSVKGDIIRYNENIYLQIICRDGGSYSTYEGNFTLFKRISDTMVHDGVEYRKVSRKAMQGDVIVFVRGNSVFNVGDVVTVHDRAVIKDDGIAFVNGSSGTYPCAKFDVYERITPVTKQYVNVGDLVRITGYQNGAKLGEVVTVTHVGSNSISYGGYLAAYDCIEVLTQSETEAHVAALKTAEAARVESAKWERIGRKVGVYKRGDLVEVTRGHDSAGTKTGSIAEVKTQESGGVYLSREDPQGMDAWVPLIWIKLVTPVEARFDYAQ
jgi:hypothetical protein